VHHRPDRPRRVGILTGVAGLAAAAALCAMLGSAPRAGSAEESAAAVAPRVEARSKSFLAVGVVHGEQMNIHLSRLLDNAPVHDASIEVAMRALKLNAVAQTDGSYTVRSPELAAAGPAVVAFTVTQGGATEKMSGDLEMPAFGKKLADNGQARQMLWWALNFGVCIGFLVLYSRRSKAAAARGED
jgi:hypothetical protein